MTLGSSNLVLCRWHLGFNPCTYPFIIQHHWVLLIGFCIELQQSKVFQMVGNQLGKSIFFDEIRLRSNNKKMVVLLIELDISKGLISELEIVCGDFSFIRPLNYCGLLLRCRRCCKVGYLIIKKSLLLLQKLLFLIKILNMLFFLTLIVLQAILVLKDTDS